MPVGQEAHAQRQPNKLYTASMLFVSIAIREPPATRRYAPTTVRRYAMNASPTNTENLKDNLSEASSHLKSAASYAGEAIKGAAGAAGDELKLGKANVKAELSDSALSGLAAAEFGGAAAKEQVDVLLDKGRDLIDSAAELIRERPLASFGVAFATGWIIAKLARSSDK
ncbi:hypothetical protein XTALMG727_1227 [Xanthomonas translucens pv. arrhenatheri LMG 727]|uniref:DUF883 domain-containing protein n=5 Tax=Xanthomonas translucens group TaxID=3390202 RepID=A0A0K2ZNZ8_9XANT|nr:hypothetical protein XTALMG727_1227 [Xanthomonas translucens pv. arrhenatheri LMG 727]